MKTVCPVCEQAVETTKAIIEKDSGIEGGDGFLLIQRHPPVPSKKTSRVVNSTTGEVLEEWCDGSLRPPKISLQ